MAMVKFASMCDVRDSRGHVCGKRSEEYTQWLVCRSCGHHVCTAHVIKGTVAGHERDTEDGAVYWETTQCRACLDNEGADDHCDFGPWQDEAEARDFARAERIYAEEYGGSL